MALTLEQLTGLYSLSLNLATLGLPLLYLEYDIFPLGAFV